MEPVVGVDEGTDRAFESFGVGEVAATKAAPLQDAEPDLNLREPARVVGQEVELDAARMGCDPVVDDGTAMDVEVVEHQMDDLAGGDDSVEEVQEGDHLLAAALLSDLADDLSGVHVEGGQQAACPVTDVLDRAPGQLARPAQGQVGEAALEGLDAGLLVEAPDRAVAGRVHVELDDGPHLGLEVGVRLPLPIGDAVGLEAGSLEDALNGAGADGGNPAGADQGLGEEVTAPVGVGFQSELLRRSAGRRHHGVAFDGADPAWAAGTRGIPQARQTPLAVATTPFPDHVAAACQRAGDAAQRQALCGQENDLGSKDQALRAGRPEEDGLQVVPLLGLEFGFAMHGKVVTERVGSIVSTNAGSPRRIIACASPIAREAPWSSGYGNDSGSGGRNLPTSRSVSAPPSPTSTVACRTERCCLSAGSATAARPPSGASPSTSPAGTATKTRSCPPAPSRAPHKRHSTAPAGSTSTTPRPGSRTNAGEH